MEFLIGTAFVLNIWVALRVDNDLSWLNWMVAGFLAGVMFIHYVERR